MWFLSAKKLLVLQVVSSTILGLTSINIWFQGCSMVCVCTTWNIGKAEHLMNNHKERRAGRLAHPALQAHSAMSETEMWKFPIRGGLLWNRWAMHSPGWWFQAPHMHEPHDILCIAWLPNLDLLWVAEQERLLIISTSLAWLKWNDFTFTLCSVHTPAWNQKPECWEKARYKKSSAAAKCLKRRAAPTVYFLNVSCEWN